jgi:cytochrome oxidase Cu insertion factor (SCO1/SenC/PrrC family)
MFEEWIVIRLRIILGLLMLSIASLLAACGEATPTTTIITAPPGGVTAPPTATVAANGKIEIGAVAPDFTMKGVNGENIQLSALRGKPVIVNFWAVY